MLAVQEHRPGRLIRKRKPSLVRITHILLRKVVLRHPVLDVVYSQPQDTGSGNDMNTQLVYAVDYLKVCDLSTYLLQCID